MRLRLANSAGRRVGLAARISEAGYRLAVAQDVLVCHFGPLPFKGLGMDVRGQVLRDLGTFRIR